MHISILRLPRNSQVFLVFLPLFSINYVPAVGCALENGAVLSQG